MNEDKLHPTVREFKSFLTKHPKLIEEVRRSGKSWQDHYEKWILLGEDDPYWDDYKEESSNKTKNKEGKNKQTEIFNQLLKLTENVDLDKIQKQAHQLSNTLSTVQEVLGQFQDTKKSLPLPTNTRSQDQGFNWFRD